MLIGSCFSEHIGNYFKRYQIPCEINPFGTLYDPISISHLLQKAASKQYLEENWNKNIVQQDGVWYHLQTHSHISALTKEDLIQKLMMAFQNTHNYLKRTTCLMITLGTNNVHYYEGKVPVANCHKIPAQQFSVRSLTANEITEHLDTTMKFIQKINPNIQIIYSVSPVRHTKLGLVENSLSKATLQVALHQLLHIVAHKDKAFYFPAYEIMLDILRDYRFYKIDKIHPSEEAIAFIWERFSQTCFDSMLQQYLSEAHTIFIAQQHRTCHEASTSSQYFFKMHYEKVLTLKRTYPHLNFEVWEEYFKKKIH